MHGFSVDSKGRSGGLAILWAKSCEVVLQNFFQYHIDMSVKLGGDFNEILAPSEKSGGPPRPAWQIRRFRSALQECELADIGCMGDPFTWSNRHAYPNTVKERLDRACANLGWAQLFPNASVSHIPVSCSDHSALLIRLLGNPICMKPQSRPWRFEAAWAQSSDCERVVAEGWFLGGQNRIERGVSQQIASCQVCLSGWSKRTFQCDKKRVQSLENRLSVISSGLMTEALCEEASNIRKELERIAAFDETKWRQRSKDLWLREGDQNTAFFHRRASHRFQTNMIRRIKNSEGVWVEEAEDIQKCILEYFGGIFASSQPQRDNIAKGTEHLRRVVDARMAEDLLQPYIEAEVTKALFQMASFKSPGPDGMPLIFFQKFWHIVHKDVTACVLSLLNSFIMPSELNATHIVLIPKCKHPESLTQFRPISLCNVVYKIASKTIANRLNLILDTIISPSQSAFVPGRLITDNILLAFELNHFLNSKTKGGQSYMALKLDVSKAYDKVKWAFLE
ncbi:UNVERIFIED_CONTAM: hypothetical protein Slati_0798400 [Sesamum latifolium]|uniref:Reverse transcriptase domain-containing protein n=1 Tax=Sesamum latifolium TaxID=2727402 RepID=A0AAW2XNR9_9LAMI